MLVMEKKARDYCGGSTLACDDHHPDNTKKIMFWLITVSLSMLTGFIPATVCRANSSSRSHANLSSAELDNDH
jgi:hypothetical protein